MMKSGTREVYRNFGVGLKGSLGSYMVKDFERASERFGTSSCFACWKRKCPSLFLFDLMRGGDCWGIDYLRGLACNFAGLY